MKKNVFLILVVFALIGFISCTKEDKRTLNIKVVSPDGAPLLSLAKVWTDNETILDDYTVDYQKLSGADDLTAQLLSKEPDFAIAPINIAAKVYNDGLGYLFAGVSIWGIMHIVSNQNIQSLSELKGENVFAFAKAGTPGITIRSILSQNNIEFTENIDGSKEAGKVNIIYLADAANVREAIIVGKLNNIDVKFALLPEPVATAIAGATLSSPHGSYSAKINLETEWKNKNNGSSYPQAGLIFHERLLKNDKAFVDKFIEAVKESTTWAFNNPEEAGNLAKNTLLSTGIPNGTVVKAAVLAGRLNLSFLEASLSKESVNNYLTIIKNDNANSINLIGGKLPRDEFYYQK
ncbi:MAG: ABC transporter substrate-binding protein [Acholeplasmatales bacterium]|jgi:NitT/TauT family transport system substrate-binding protein|nr:ABC transporter substrate-binding protein [Acholeplasmatales bacterium]